MSKLVFMGHVLSAWGIRPAEVKVQAVVNAREPETETEVKSFLGLVTYSSRYTPDFSTISEPLRRLLKTNKPFTWGDEQQESFDKLKSLLADADTLGYYSDFFTCASRVPYSHFLLWDSHFKSQQVPGLTKL